MFCLGDVMMGKPMEEIRFILSDSGSVPCLLGVVDEELAC